MVQQPSVPADGRAITVNADFTLNVPDNPVIPYIEGDGIGVDITPVMIRVVDAAVARAYGGQRRIAWMEIHAGEKATRLHGADAWLPAETLAALKQYVVSIKGPLTTPVGGGIRSLNVALRQELDLYVCLRPVRYFPGVPSPLRQPEKTDMVIFRENSEDIYAGIEWEAGSEGPRRLIAFLKDELGVNRIRFPETSGLGIKPVSREGTERLVRKAIQYAIDHDRPSVTLVHKGNIMKYTEGAFRDWGYALARAEFGAEPVDGGPWCRIRHPRTGRDILVKDSIADAFLQQILMRPAEYSVIATLNLNGDYVSDALAAQVGGIGIAPGANMSDSVAMFEATHGTAPKYAGKDYVNPGSLILSAEMMLRHIGWTEAADLIVAAMGRAIASKKVTYDFARLMEGATQVSCSGFGEVLIEKMPAGPAASPGGGTRQEAAQEAAASRDYERIGRFIYGFQRLADPDALRALPGSGRLAPALEERGAALARRFDAALAAIRGGGEGAADPAADGALSAILDELRAFVADSGWTPASARPPASQ